MPDAPPILKGTLDVLVLKTLSWEPMHGFEITEWLERRSGGVLGVEDGALYHAIHRLEIRGLIEGEWGLTENKRRARYYRLTRAGRKWLRDETASWLRYAGAVTGVLRASSRAGA